MNPSPKPDKRGKTLLAFAVASSLILTGTVIYYFQGNQVKEIPETATSTSLYNSSLGLQLILNISNTSIGQGEYEKINVQVYNTYDSMNSITPERNLLYFASGYTISAGPCDNSPYGIAVIQGNYSLSNLNYATPLPIFEPGIYNCPAEFTVSQYQFLAHSTKANIYSNSSSPPMVGTTDFNLSLMISGYWIGNLQSHSFEKFSPGIYTVVAADGWGQATVLHFEVT